jgi:hypothetical protein
VSGTRVAETILASVRMRAHQQAGHMDASDLIKSLQRQPCEEGAVHIWGPDADRHAKLLIYLAVEGSLLDACSHKTKPAPDLGAAPIMEGQISMRFSSLATGRS